MRFFLIIGMLCCATPAFAQKLIAGQCTPTSHMVHGKIGADLTLATHKPITCDSVFIIFLPERHHVLLEFVQTGSETPNIGFAGWVSDDGLAMKVERIYYGNSKEINVNEGACKFFFDGMIMDSMMCGSMYERNDKRYVSVVEFKARKSE